jgi:DNA-binding NtrC family response regulator/predicted hydrocarbon binding protein
MSQINLKSKTASSAQESQEKTRIQMPDVLVDMNAPLIREFANKLRFSPNEGRIWLGERRMVLLHAEAFSSLREELIASLGFDTSRGLLTRIGYAAGCRDAEMAWSIAGHDAGLPELFRIGAVMHAMQGFVLPENLARTNRLEDITPDNFHAEWIWKQCIEDDGHIQNHGFGNHAVCWTEVGYSSGFLSTCLGKRILVRELECRAMGHTHCRNVAKPVALWEDPSDDLRFLEPQAPAATKVYVPNINPPIITEPVSETKMNDFVVGASIVSLVLHHKILRVAKTNATVLLLGESGVGKSLIAREVHRNSKRSSGQMLEVNCAAIPEQLIESELFGVERGAYSGAVTSRPGRFEAANGGTLFLDEIGTLSMTAQGKLLRVLQTGEFERLGSNKTLKTDVRLIAATNEDLRNAVQEGRFREDLYYRLNVFPLHILPLRERRDDIPLLTDVLLRRFAKRHERRIQGVTPRAMRALMHHTWPGNIRELENVLERGIILSQEDETIDIHHLFNTDNQLSTTGLFGLGEEGKLSYLNEEEELPDNGKEEEAEKSLDDLADDLITGNRIRLPEVEDALARAAMRKSRGNVSRAAELLGITRAQLDYRLKKMEPKHAAL